MLFHANRTFFTSFSPRAWAPLSHFDPFIFPSLLWPFDDTFSFFSETLVPFSQYPFAL